MAEVDELDAGTGEVALGQWAATVTAAVPYILATPATVRHELAASPHALASVAGRPAGVARIRDRVADDGSCSVLVAVTPGARGAGVGSSLHRWAERRCRALGASRVTGVVDEDGTSPDVVTHWGYTLGARSRMSWVDSRTVPDDLGALPAGSPLRLVPLSEVDPAQVWACHQLAAPDDPSGFSRRMPLEQYLETEWGDPLLRPDLSRGVLDGDRCVAYSLLRVAGDRGWSSMTATAPSHRGRGLSLVAKAAVLRAAAAAGVHRCATANAGSNAAVLALNDRLGYAPLCTVRSVVRALR